MKGGGNLRFVLLLIVIAAVSIALAYPLAIAVHNSLAQR